MSECKIKAKGKNGELEVYDTEIIIRRKGISSFITHGLKGDKTIAISSITSVQFKGVSLLPRWGFIQFAFMGGQEGQGGAYGALRDENSVCFIRKQQPLFEEAKSIIEELIKRGSSSVTVETNMSEADEIEKFATLRDKGIISEEEFKQKKDQILGM
jgi:hypothetical protein